MTIAALRDTHLIGPAQPVQYDSRLGHASSTSREEWLKPSAR